MEIARVIPQPNDNDKKIYFDYYMSNKGKQIATQATHLGIMFVANEVVPEDLLALVFAQTKVSMTFANRVQAISQIPIAQVPALQFPPDYSLSLSLPVAALAKEAQHSPLDQRPAARSIRSLGDRRLSRSLASPRPNLILDRLCFEHIKDQIGADYRQPFPVKAEWNQSVINHLYRIKWQSNRELLGVEIALIGHGRNNGIAMEFHCLI
jgi:hypothetical protein